MVKQKTTKSILVAFLLNLIFAGIELFGGLFTGSIAIVSDSIHDFADALSIGISYVLERKSCRKPDEDYTFGYARYSVLGAFITTSILFFSSLIVIYHAILRFYKPVSLNYDGMILIAVFGFVINAIAAYLTRNKQTLNEKAVSLHMLEDVLGWLVVLIGSVIIKFTNFSYLDSIMTIGIAIFLIFEALKNLKEILDLFLVKVPKNITVESLTKSVKEIEGIVDVHHVHIWSLDGMRLYATMHVTADFNPKKEIRKKLKELGITNVTIELENTHERCEQKVCK